MEYLTRELFLEKVNSLKLSNPEHWGHYEWKPAQPKSIDRWNYHEKAVEILKEINPKTILEAGSMGIFLTNESDSIDLDMPEWGWRLTYKPTYTYDLTKMPWKPIKDKQYDVFVALRVFHHMYDEARYLKEMERISNKIILALTSASAERYEKIRKADKSYYFEDTDTIVLFYE
jgi:hypothetical protein